MENNENLEQNRYPRQPQPDPIYREFIGNLSVIEIKNDINEISKVINLIEEKGEELALNFAAINAVSLSVDELLTNVISYGYKDDSMHTIVIELYSENDYFCIKIIDDGVAFNPLAKKEVDTDTTIEEKEIGGLGIHLVKSMIDLLEYERLDNKNVLILKKNINVKG